jgi:hypothetical protein
VAEFFDGLSADDYPELSLTADDMTNGDDWGNFLSLAPSAVGLDTPGVASSVQPTLLQTSSGAATWSSSSAALAADCTSKSVQHAQR